MGFSLQVSGVNLALSGHCNADQLVSPDHYPTDLKGVAVFCKSTIPLCLNALMVMSPHGLVAVANPFQLSLSPEAAFVEPTGILYPLLELLLGSSYDHFVCVVASDAIPRSCVYISQPCLPWMSLSQMRPDHWYSLNFLPQYCHQDQQWPGWTGRD